MIMITIITARRVILALIIVLILNSAPHQTYAASDLTTPVVDVTDMLNRVNKLRQSRALVPLTLNDALTRAAQEQADYISNTGNYAHVHSGSSPTTRAMSAGYQTTEWCCSENTHRTQIGKSAWEFWNYSSSHYYNMINPKWTEIGVATSNVGVWTGWVLVFGSGIQAESATTPSPTVPTVTNTPSSDAGAGAGAGGGSYRVAWGDTLFQIALHHGVTLNDLRAANGIWGDVIYPGQMLTIPNGTVIPSAETSQPSAANVIAQITSPQPGAVMQPGFAIIGTALFNPAQAQFYKVEISGGQFGGTWVTVGEVHSQNVSSGPLEFLNPVQPGAYNVRVMVVGKDSSPLATHSVFFSVR